MAQINQQLLAAIMAKTGLSRAQAYVKISKKAGDELLPRHLAAIKVAADEGLNINKYASADEIAELRSAGTPVLPPAGRSPTLSPTSKIRSSRSRPATNASKSSPNQVFVVHGRDRVAKEAMFSFLRAIGIRPIEWNAAIRMTKKATPYVGEILDAAFSNARAVVVLLTPDDWAELREDLRLPHDPPYEISQLAKRDRTCCLKLEWPSQATRIGPY